MPLKQQILEYIGTTRTSCHALMLRFQSVANHFAITDALLELVSEGLLVRRDFTDEYVNSLKHVSNTPLTIVCYVQSLNS